MANNHCLHCSTPLPQSARYCHHCGAQAVNNRLGFSQLLQDTAKIFDLEAGFIKTMADLFVMPGIVTRFYIEGGRKRYLNPLKYLAVCFMAYQLAIWLMASDYFFIALMKGFIEGRHTAASLQGPAPEKLEQLSNYSTFLFLLLLPIAALISKVLFQPDELNFVEHLFINAYLLAQVLVNGLAASLILIWFEHKAIYWLSIASSIFYILYCQYRTFSYSLAGALSRSMVFLAACFVLMLLLYSELAIMATR